jgi:hypothetical protein
MLAFRILATRKGLLPTVAFLHQLPNKRSLGAAMRRRFAAFKTNAFGRCFTALSIHKKRFALETE